MTSTPRTRTRNSPQAAWNPDTARPRGSIPVSDQERLARTSQVKRGALGRLSQ